jgi:hypothetical protein
MQISRLSGTSAVLTTTLRAIFVQSFADAKGRHRASTRGQTISHVHKGNDTLTVPGTTAGKVWNLNTFFSPCDPLPAARNLLMLPAIIAAQPA